MGRKRSAAAPEEKIELVLGASKNGAQKRTGRPSDWTEAKAEKFIEVLADSCNVSYAARAVERSVGVLRGSSVMIGGDQVLGRAAAIADPAGGATVDAEARAAVTAILSALRAHGMISP